MHNILALVFIFQLGLISNASVFEKNLSEDFQIFD